MILHRSILFVPGGRPKMVEKAARLPADVLCLDLEESVLPGSKASARHAVRSAIGPLHGGGRVTQVRVNSIQSGDTRADLEAVVQPGLVGVLLAKAQSAQDVRDVDVLLREFELSRDIKPGTIELTVAIESTRSLLRCEEISRASTRLVALMLGGEDFSFDLGVERTRDGAELAYPRAVIATCARAANIIALDTPWADIQDIEGLTADAGRAMAIGFAGKYVIHPSHVEPVHRVFSPTEFEVSRARALVEAWEKARAGGLGAVQVDGRMVDRPVAERARTVIEQAEAIAKGSGTLSGEVDDAASL